jgi:aspartyl aminopeptidase
MMTYYIQALIETSKDEKALDNEKNIRTIILFDNEEIGSATSHGAGSPLVNDIVKRITNSPELFEIAIRNSFLISADMAHAVHPNVSHKRRF